MRTRPGHSFRELAYTVAAVSVAIVPAVPVTVLVIVGLCHVRYVFVQYQKLKPITYALAVMVDVTAIGVIVTVVVVKTFGSGVLVVVVVVMAEGVLVLVTVVVE